MTSLLKPKIKKHLDDSVADELYAANMYKHLAAQMQYNGFSGAQVFFEKESATENTHYYLLRDYMNNMGDVAPCPTIDGYAEPVTDMLAAIRSAYELELDLLNKYQARAKEAFENTDMATFELFLSFVKFQVKSVGELADLETRFYRNPNDVFEFDEYLKEH